MTGSAKKSAAVLMSGGIDSAACAHLLIRQGAKVRGVFINYGQAAASHEWRAASKICARLDIPLTKYLCTRKTRFASGELTGRNSFLITAAFFFLRKKPELLAIGIHGGSPYYDCTEDFLNRMRDLIAVQTDGRVNLVAPFHEWSKAQVYDYFCTTDLPLSVTYSCETGSKRACGKCLSCRDRRALGVS